MPELPEVETIARGLHRLVRGRTISSVHLGSKPEPFRSSPAVIARALTGNIIGCVHRVGKHVVVDLLRKDSDVCCAQWLIHLGMTGRLLISGPEVPLVPHTHAILQLDDGREIRFVDPRRFGRLSVLELSPPSDVPRPYQTGSGPGSSSQTALHSAARQKRSSRRTTITSGFHGSGQEPLEIPFDAFRALFRGRRTPIKSALLNQSLLQGIGNIYADESLYRAGIRPRRQAGRLTGRELAQLHRSIQSVLREAIALGGSSVSDYVDASGTKGFFQLEHKVYLRTGQPCLSCGTPIRRILIAGRGTHFCPNCQH